MSAKPDLLTFAAALARGEYHPSHCVEDYQKGTSRVAFAAIAGEYADRARSQVGVLKRAAARIAELEAERAAAPEMADLLRGVVSEGAHSNPNGFGRAWLSREWRARRDALLASLEVEPDAE